MPNKPNCTFVIDPNARIMTDNEICRMLFGKSVQDLSQAIRDNKDGKYDELYVHD